MAQYVFFILASSMNNPFTRRCNQGIPNIQIQPHCRGFGLDDLSRVPSKQTIFVLNDLIEGFLCVLKLWLHYTVIPVIIFSKSFPWIGMLNSPPPNILVSTQVLLLLPHIWMKKNPNCKCSLSLFTYEFSIYLTKCCLRKTFEANRGLDLVRSADDRKN